MGGLVEVVVLSLSLGSVVSTIVAGVCRLGSAFF